MGRVISYEEKTGISDGDYLLLDNGNGGTKRIRADLVGPQVDSVPIEGSTNPVQSGGVKSALDALQTQISQLGPEAVQGYVEDWLDDHPEATTTVQDGAITEAKLTEALRLKTINDYVTPQMYGAKADGTTDDLTAFQNTFASGKKVLIPSGSYYLTDYVFVDESQLIDDKGTYSNKKIVTSKTITSASMSVADRKSITLSALGTRWGSGVAYNSDTGKLICCGYEDDKIAQVDFATLTVEQTVTIEGLGHGNDATYNPNTGKYYCAPMGANGEIMVINSDLSLNTMLTIEDMDFAPSQISYDPDNDIYYIGNSQYTYVVDANFTIIKLLSTHSNNEIFANAYEHINAPASQGSAVYNGQFLGGVWLGATGVALERGRSYARLVTYDYNSGEIKDFYDFPMHINAEEFETVEVIDGKLCLFSCRFGTLFITTVYPDKIHLSHDTTKYPYYTDATYTTNSYCTAADLKRVRTFVHGNIGVIKFNLNLSATALPASTNNITIGNLGVRPYDEFLAVVPSQKNQGNLLVDIKTNGDIVVSNPNSGVTLDGFFRTVIPILIQ